VPSAVSPELSDATKYKYYIANCSSVTATSTTIGRIILPNSLTNTATGTAIVSPTTTYTTTAYNITTNVIACNNDLVLNQAITFGTAFANIVVGVTYYVASIGLTRIGFSVSASINGSVLQLSGSSSAIVSIVSTALTICTTTGLVGSIPNPNSAPTTNTSTATAACLYLNQLSTTTKEYVVVLTMGYANMSGSGATSGYAALVATATNGCTVAKHSLFVFQIDPTNSANLIYKSSLADGTAFGTNAALFNINTSADNTYIILSNITQFVILKWSNITESYAASRVYTISDGIGRISLDIQNRLWIHSNTTANVWIYHLTNSTDVEINFKNNVTSRDYSGANVSQDVIINCYNVIGSRLAKSVTLVVSGPAVFTATGTSTVAITTSTTADSIISLTITGSGSIQVIPTLVV
jgi:hypothetical protein